MKPHDLKKLMMQKSLGKSYSVLELLDNIYKFINSINDTILVRCNAINEIKNINFVILPFLTIQI